MVYIKYSLKLLFHFSLRKGHITIEFSMCFLIWLIFSLLSNALIKSINLSPQTIITSMKTSLMAHVQKAMR